MSGLFKSRESKPKPFVGNKTGLTTNESKNQNIKKLGISVFDTKDVYNQIIKRYDTKDELNYLDDAFGNHDIYDFSKYRIIQKINMYNTIREMRTDDLRNLIGKGFLLTNNYLKDGLLEIKKLPPTGELNSDELVNKYKNMFKMNLILSILFFELKPIFIDEFKFNLSILKINANDLKGLNVFDLENKWLGFCNNIYHTMEELFKDAEPSSITEEDVVKIIQGTVDEYDYKPQTRTVPNMFGPGTKEVAVKPAIIDMKKSLNKGFNVAKSVLTSIKNAFSVPTLEIPTSNDVQLLFSRFMIILFKYEKNINTFPNKIELSYTGDFTGLQEQFIDIVDTQSTFIQNFFYHNLDSALINTQVAQATNMNAQNKELKNSVDRLNGQVMNVVPDFNPDFQEVNRETLSSNNRVGGTKSRKSGKNGKSRKNEKNGKNEKNRKTKRQRK